MKNILFLPDEAERINQKVSQKIDSHLFLFCNYQPDQVRVFSSDARFCQGVMNLYKLVVDASIISMIPQIARANNICWNGRELDKCIKTISMLRTVLGHNVSVRNGTGELLEQYELWLKKVTGKTELQEGEDYEPAVKVLEQIGEDIYKIVSQFIDRAALCPRKEAVITTWEDAIFLFYKKQSGQQIFLGQMRDAYLSRCPTGSIHMRKHYLKRKVAHWFESFYCQKEKTQIENLQNILVVYGAKLDRNVCYDIQKEIEVEKDKLKEIKKEIALKLGVVSPDQLTFYQYQECYCMDLEKKLRNIFCEMKKSSQKSMLPESLMQELIEKEFADIHSEDF